MAEALIIQDGEVLDWTADAAYSAGDVVQVPDGRAGVILHDCASGDVVAVEVTAGKVIEVLKTASMVMLSGSQLYWDHSANKAHLLHGGDKDFELGCALADAAANDTTVRVALNQEPSYNLSLEEGFASLPISTAGFPHLVGSGEGVSLILDATVEAQKVDALSARAAAPAGISFVDALIQVNDKGNNAALRVRVGLANGTHATDPDLITESLFVDIDGNSANISLESDDGTTSVAGTDSTVDLTEGTPFLVQWDLRDLTDIQVYINGVNVLPASVFRLDAATGPLKLLAYAVKSANATTGNVSVLELGAR